MSAQSLGPNQTKWIAALRSGEFTQGDGHLHFAGRHCCLGVGCVTFEIPGEWLPVGACAYGLARNPDTAPQELVDILALRDDDGIFSDGVSLEGQRSLTQANDSGISFVEIADFSEQHPEAVFTEAR